jgi:mannose-6-phosphate isomerase-like protein (cupin superfamily)
MLSGMKPSNIAAALDSFDAIWSPRILNRVNDYDVRIAKVKGEHIWHAHDNTDEFFLVLDGVFNIGLRENGVETSVTLRSNETFVVPLGMEHRPWSEEGASILMFEPMGTPSTGDRHEDIPNHVDSTTGHNL